jgi:hypothetical protein
MTEEAKALYEAQDRYLEMADHATHCVVEAHWDRVQQCYSVQLRCGHTLEVSQSNLRSPILCVKCVSEMLVPPTTTAVVD